jgi:serine/threonine protein phosphatase PrpC
MFIGVQKNELNNNNELRENMLKIIKVAYLTQKWVRGTTWALLLLGSLLFFWLTGGFPPHGWRVLAQAMANLPELWMLSGPAVLLPLFVLCIYSLILLLVWMFLISALLWATVQQRNYLQTWRHVEQAAREVQHEHTVVTKQTETQTHVNKRKHDWRTNARKGQGHANKKHGRFVEEDGRPQGATPPHNPTPVPTIYGQDEHRSIVGTGAGWMRGGAPCGRPSSPSASPDLSDLASGGRPSSPSNSPDLYGLAPCGRPSSLETPQSQVPQQHSPVLPVARNKRTVNLNPTPSPLLEQALQVQQTHQIQAQGGVGIMTGPLTQPFLPRTPVTEPQQKAPDAAVALRVGTGLDAGITRKEKPNEDHLLAVHGTHTYNADYRPYGLFVVADGMGGHANGQEASRLVIQHIRNAIIPTLLSNVDLKSEDSKELLLEGIQHANLAIYQQNRQQGSDMGSTITAAILVGSMLTVANVGDSRTYQYNAQRGLTQVTHDHSMVARMVEKGMIGVDEIYTHPQRNQIYRCLGENASVQVDAFSLAYQPGDTLLLCSDGLWEMVRDVRIQDILHKTLPDAALSTQSLVQAALAGGGKDNISAIVVHHA